MGGYFNIFYLCWLWDDKVKKFKNDLLVDEVWRIVNFFGIMVFIKVFWVCIVDVVDDMNVSFVNVLLKIFEELFEYCLFLVFSYVLGCLLLIIWFRCCCLFMLGLIYDEIIEGLCELNVCDLLGDVDL